MKFRSDPGEDIFAPVTGEEHTSEKGISPSFFSSLLSKASIGRIE